VATVRVRPAAWLLFHLSRSPKTETGVDHTEAAKSKLKRGAGAFGSSATDS
jgi:hypothetical protein